MRDPVTFRDAVVIGGGCYGTFYASQLDKARRRGRARYRRVLVVDHDPACRARRELGEAADRALVVAEWDSFCDNFLDGAADEPGVTGDVIVPSPHMPHLMFAWVVRRARRRWPGRRVVVAPFDDVLGTPYDRAAADGTRYVSFADWVCPTHCIEPVQCPAIGAARTWEMPDAVRALAAREPLAGPALFVCRHLVFGVGAFSVASVLAADRLVADAGAQPAGVRILIGTVSSCHGALNVLELGAQQAAVEGSGGVREPQRVV